MVYHSGTFYIYWKIEKVLKKNDEILAIWLPNNSKYEFTYKDIETFKEDDNWILIKDILSKSDKNIISKSITRWMSDVDKKWQNILFNLMEE